MDDELVRQTEARPETGQGVVVWWCSTRGSAFEDHRGVDAEVLMDPLGGEGADGDDRVGATKGLADQESLAPGSEPGECPWHVEDRQVVHGRDRRRTRSQREIDVETMDQVGRTHGAQRSQGSAHTVRPRSHDRVDPCGQQGSGIRLHNCGHDLRRDGAQCREHLADVGLDPGS